MGVFRLELARSFSSLKQAAQVTVGPWSVVLPCRAGCFSSSDLLVPFLLLALHSGRKNSRTMLLPLLQKFPERVRVSLFHTPNLRGLLRLLIPERFNETIGLQHIKAYLFDNNVILSG